MQIHSFGKIISRRQNTLPEQRSGSSALIYKIIIADGRRHQAWAIFRREQLGKGTKAHRHEERVLNVGAVKAPHHTSKSPVGADLRVRPQPGVPLVAFLHEKKRQGFGGRGLGVGEFFVFARVRAGALDPLLRQLVPCIIVFFV